ncbi:MAG: His/Glu/Gln/Arg/opine family amino acid ABC transporter permease subunit, partial [Arcobacteraceae bacterium]
MDSLFTPLSWSDTGFILTGILNTVYISVVAIVIGTFLGAIVGFTRAEASKYVNMIIGSILDILRSVPLIIQLILFTTYIGAMGYPLDPFLAGSIVLSLY